VAKSEKTPRANLSFEQLERAWWTIFDAYDWLKNYKIKVYLTRKPFEQLLAQVGWTVEEWNTELARKKNKKSKK